jgi:hypothetical protein
MAQTKKELKYLRKTEELALKTLPKINECIDALYTHYRESLRQLTEFYDHFMGMSSFTIIDMYETNRWFTYRTELSSSNIISAGIPFLEKLTEYLGVDFFYRLDAVRLISSKEKPEIFPLLLKRNSRSSFNNIHSKIHSDRSYGSWHLFVSFEVPSWFMTGVLRHLWDRLQDIQYEALGKDPAIEQYRLLLPDSVQPILSIPAAYMFDLLFAEGKEQLKLDTGVISQWLCGHVRKKAL